MKDKVPTLEDIQVLISQLPDRADDAVRLNKDSSLVTGLGLSSIELTELLLSIEDHFNITLPLESLRMEDVSSIDGFLEFLFKRAITFSSQG